MITVLAVLQKAVSKIRTRRGVLMVIILVTVTLLLGTFGFAHFENEKMDEDYGDALEEYREAKQSDPLNVTEADRPSSPDHIDHFTSLYWTVTTVTTVGYGDISPVSDNGRVVFFAVAFLGISTISLALGEFASFLVEMKLMNMRGLSKKKIKNHTILVGWNSVTKSTYNELMNRKIDTVVVDPDADPMDMKSQDINFISGDPNTRDILERAKVAQAKTMLIPLTVDQDTLMIATKAKQLNRDLRIIATCDSLENRQTLLDAGVNMVIPTSEVQGQMLANAIDEEKVIDFVLDVMQEDMGLDIDEYWPKEKMTVGAIPLEQEQKVILIYKRGTPTLMFDDRTTLDSGDWALILEKCD